MRRTGVDAAVCSVGNRHDERDPKGLYEKADRGKVINLTGRDQPYEVPEDPVLVLRTAELRPKTPLIEFWNSYCERRQCFGATEDFVVQCGVGAKCFPARPPLWFSRPFTTRRERLIFDE
jgi:Adenylylsulphate kinase